MSGGHDIRIARNSVFSLVRNVLSVPVLLFLTPYTLHRLGMEMFGVWALAGMLSSYAQLSDFGVTESLIKYVAEYQARGDEERLNRLLNSALVLFLLFTTAGTILLVAAMGPVVEHVLSIPPHLQARSVRIFSLSLAIFSLNLAFGVFSSLVAGFQRMDVTNGILLAVTLANAAGTVAFLEGGYGIEGLVWNNALCTVLAVALNAWQARRLFPSLSLNPYRHWSGDEARRVLSFSWKVQVSNLTQVAIFQADRVVLSHFVGLHAVGLYEVANRVAAQARGIVASAFVPMAPAASAMHARDERELILGLYRRSLKYMAALAVPFLLLVAGLAGPFVRTWVGDGYGESALALQVLSLAFLVNLLTGPGAFVLNGIGRPEIGMRSSVLGAVLNLAFCLLLVGPFGYRGVLAGVSASLTISGAWFLSMFHSNLPGLPASVYRSSLGRPLLVSGPLFLLLILLDRHFRIRGYLPLVGITLAYGAAAASAFLPGKFLDEYDRSLFRRLLLPKG